MRIGIISDTHGRLETVKKTLRLLREKQVELVLHCGDIDNPETIELFAGFPIHFVFGNCDWDQSGLAQAMENISATLHDQFGHLELEGTKIAWLHGDDGRLFRDVENSDHYDFLFYGHTHQAKEHRTGKTRVINPGALHRARVKTFMILNLPSGEAESVVVE